MHKWFKKLFGFKDDCCCHKGEDCCQNKEEHKTEEAATPMSAPEASSEAPVAGNGKELKVE